LQYKEADGSTYNFDPGSGILLSKVDQNGNTTTLHYDSRMPEPGSKL